MSESFPAGVWGSRWRATCAISPPQLIRDISVHVLPRRRDWASLRWGGARRTFAAVRSTPYGAGAGKKWPGISSPEGWPGWPRIWQVTASSRSRILFPCSFRTCGAKRSGVHARCMMRDAALRRGLDAGRALVYYFEPEVAVPGPVGREPLSIPLGTGRTLCACLPKQSLTRRDGGEGSGLWEGGEVPGGAEIFQSRGRAREPPDARATSTLRARRPTPVGASTVQVLDSRQARTTNHQSAEGGRGLIPETPRDSPMPPGAWASQLALAGAQIQGPSSRPGHEITCFFLYFYFCKDALLLLWYCCMRRTPVQQPPFVRRGSTG